MIIIITILLDAGISLSLSPGSSPTLISLIVLQ